MLNFKKGSIFSRSEGNEDAYEEYEQEDQGGVLAVWGSPGSCLLYTSDAADE